jgi:microcystin-dependent protein
MGVVNTTYTFNATDVVTSAKLNNVIDETTFTSTAITGTTLALLSGSLKVNSLGIGANELANDSVTTVKILDGAVTAAKLAAGAALPAGAVMPFAMATAPTGWFSCDGTLLSRTTYALLFAAIGTTFGVGDGSTTFAIPDLRGYFVRGFGTNNDTVASGAFGTNQVTDNLSHNHSVTVNNAGNHNHITPAGSGIFTSIAGGGFTVTTNTSGNAHSIQSLATSGEHNHGASSGASGGTESRPYNIALLYCIKY